LHAACIIIASSYIWNMTPAPFIRSKLLKFLLPIVAFAVFFISWINNRILVYYNNVPEETVYFEKPEMGAYAIIAYVLLAGFIIHFILGLVYLRSNRYRKMLSYILIGNLVLASYFFWVYSLMLPQWRSNAILLFLNLALFAICIFNLLPEKN
jgi:hypothetical protein